jgi:hypothetical protein
VETDLQNVDNRDIILEIELCVHVDSQRLAIPQIVILLCSDNKYRHGSVLEIFDEISTQLQPRIKFVKHLKKAIVSGYNQVQQWRRNMNIGGIVGVESD